MTKLADVSARDVTHAIIETGAMDFNEWIATARLEPFVNPFRTHPPGPAAANTHRPQSAGFGFAPHGRFTHLSSLGPLLQRHPRKCRNHNSSFLAAALNLGGARHNGRSTDTVGLGVV